jgi:tetratricopeptide (TPR) repeat protein
MKAKLSLLSFLIVSGSQLQLLAQTAEQADAELNNRYHLSTGGRFYNKDGKRMLLRPLSDAHLVLLLRSDEDGTAQPLSVKIDKTEKADLSNTNNISEEELLQKLLPKLHLKPNEQLVEVDKQVAIATPIDERMRLLDFFPISQLTVDVPYRDRHYKLVNEYWTMGIVMEGANNFDSANNCFSAYIRQYQDLLKTWPSTKNTWNNYYFAIGYEKRAACRIKLKQYEQAIYDLTQAIELRPWCVKNYSDRAAAYRMSGQPKLADEDELHARSLPALTMNPLQDLETELSSERAVNLQLP